MIDSDCPIPFVGGTVETSPPTPPGGVRRNYRVTKDTGEDIPTTQYPMCRLLEVMPLNQRKRCGSCKRIFTPIG
ncbi:MAG TPA: hypothetical protein VEW42_01760 [Candidatus Eisenbacteria bacterium]|nr:hypothetical protein [Candidatus Eisenbacteria bacterium]